MDENTLRKDPKKPTAVEALARVLEIAEDEGYTEGWDAAFDIGYQSGGHNAAHVFVEALCKANDKYTAETFDVKENGKKQNAKYDRTIGRFLELLENELPFFVDYTNCVPVFPHELEKKEDYNVLEDEEDGDVEV